MKDIAQTLLSLIRDRQKTSTLITVAEAARELKTTQKNVIQTAADNDININVGIGGSGGYANLRQKDWTLEDLNAPYHE
jgi:hypothetical protein